MADRFYRTKRPADDVEITTLGFKKGILGPLQKADITHVGDLRRWGPVAVSQINGIGQLRLSMISTAIVEWNVKTIESPHPPPAVIRLQPSAAELDVLMAALSNWNSHLLAIHGFDPMHQTDPFIRAVIVAYRTLVVSQKAPEGYADLVKFVASIYPSLAPDEEEQARGILAKIFSATIP